MQFQFAVMTPPYDRREMVAELVSRVNDAAGQSIRADAEYSSLRLAELEAGDRLPRFLEVLDWALRTYGQASAAE